jgi:hypothetical protein
LFVAADFGSAQSMVAEALPRSTLVRGGADSGTEKDALGSGAGTPWFPGIHKACG